MSADQSIEPLKETFCLLKHYHQSKTQSTKHNLNISFAKIQLSWHRSTFQSFPCVRFEFNLTWPNNHLSTQTGVY